MKKKCGHPVTVWTEKKIKETIEEMEQYTDESAIPIFAEFAYKHHYNRTKLYSIVPLRDSIKRMMMKKEAQLEKLALAGKAAPAMCIFSLKQLGWSDKQEIDVTEHKIVVSRKKNED